MDWKSETFKRLDAIGEKLGVAAAHLWSVLIRQGIAVGMQDCLIGMVWLGLWIAAMVISRHMRKTLAVKDDYEGENWIVGGYVLMGLAQLFLVGVGAYLFQGIVELVNPEFYALQTLLQSLK